VRKWCVLFFNFIPQAYVDKSAYGTYCCAAWSTGRVLRNITFKWLINHLGFVLYNLIAVMSGNKGFEGSVVAPALSLSRKRLCAMFLTSVLIHDSPVKNVHYVCGLLAGFIWLNMGIAASWAAAGTFPDLVTYLVLDYLSFVIRMIVLGRLGMQQFPKLVRFLVTKNIENLPSCMPNHIAAQGQITSMKTAIAFVAVSEGTSLTMCILLQTVCIIFLYISNDWKSRWFFPSQEPLLVIVSVICVSLQDCVSNVVSNKISSLSFLFKKNGFLGKEFQAVKMILYLSLNFYFFMAFVSVAPNRNTRELAVIFSSRFQAASMHGTLHY
jgi:hypothetical protein